MKNTTKMDKRDKADLFWAILLLVLAIALVGTIVWLAISDVQDNKAWNDGICKQCGEHLYYNSAEQSFMSTTYECINGHKLKISDFANSQKVEDIEKIRAWNNGKCKRCGTNWELKSDSNKGYIFECENQHFLTLEGLPE